MKMDKIGLGTKIFGYTKKKTGLCKHKCYRQLQGLKSHSFWVVPAWNETIHAICADKPVTQMIISRRRTGKKKRRTKGRRRRGLTYSKELSLALE